MASINVSVINKSTIDSDEIKKCMEEALQPQVSKEFFEAWNVDAKLTFVDNPSNSPNGTWWLVILNDTDQDDWFGYHVTSAGFPLAKVFARTIQKQNKSWSITASHELLEMLADPTINRMVSKRKFTPADLPAKGEKQADFYVLEVCDPVAPDECGYDKGGFMVSDFVLPSWFESNGQPPYDKNPSVSKLSQPFTSVSGGYHGFYSSQDGWQLVTPAKLSEYREKMKDHGRYWLRKQPGSIWTPVPKSALGKN